MQKDKAEKFYLTKRKLQMRKTAKITDYFPGSRDCMRKKQSPPQKDGGDFVLATIGNIPMTPISVFKILNTPIVKINTIKLFLVIISLLNTS